MGGIQLNGYARSRPVTCARHGIRPMAVIVDRARPGASAAARGDYPHGGVAARAGSRDYFASVRYDTRSLIGPISGPVAPGRVATCTTFSNMMMNGEFASTAFCSAS